MMISPFELIAYSIMTLLATAEVPGNATGTIPASMYPDIVTQVDRNEILIGDEFNLTVTFTRDPQIEILEKGRTFDLGQFEIKDIQPLENTILEDGRVEETTIYKLSTYFTGEFEIPPLDIRFQTQDGRVGAYQTSPIQIHVRSLTPEESENLDIRDIKEPVVIAGNSRWWIIVVVIALLFAIAALVYWLKNRKQETAVPSEPPLPPHIVAYRALDDLRKRTDLIEEQRYKDFSTLLSEIIRMYIVGRWEIDALDLTSFEIIQRLRQQSLSTDLEPLFVVFFEGCDMIKFAKHQPTNEEIDTYIHNAVRIVDETKIDMEQAEEPTRSNPEAHIAVGE
jgi:hypothetical protein